MDWFLYDSGLRHESVRCRTTFAIIYKIKHLIYQDAVKPNAVQVVAFSILKRVLNLSLFQKEL